MCKDSNGQVCAKFSGECCAEIPEISHTEALHEKMYRGISIGEEQLREGEVQGDKTVSQSVIVVIMREMINMISS